MGEKPKRPDWLWEKEPDGSYVYRGNGTQDVREHIEHLEARYIRDCDQITRLWERLGNYRSRIKELEARP